MSNNSDNSRIVLMGKSKSKSTPDLLSMLGDVDPRNVPANLLDGVFVTMVDKSRFQIDKRHLSNGINYDQIYSQVKAAGAKTNIDTIEIIVDIDYAKLLVDRQAEALLGPYFN